MHWILIAYIYSGYSGGPVAAEFNNQSACEAAISAMRKDASFSRRFDSAICVPKG